MDDYEEKPPKMPNQSEVITILSPHTYKTKIELEVWWNAGVDKQAKEPLAEWKTDNPRHPKYQQQDVFDPTKEEA